MPISPQERSTLITLARAAVDASVRGSTLPVPRCEGILSRRLGCFVTLTNSGMLRGCIGTFQPEESLGRTLVQMATAAATQDPRFTTRPITPTELEQLQVEVSVLSELVETDKPERLEVANTASTLSMGHGRDASYPRSQPTWDGPHRNFSTSAAAPRRASQPGLGCRRKRRSICSHQRSFRTRPPRSQRG